MVAESSGSNVSFTNRSSKLQADKIHKFFHTATQVHGLTGRALVIIPTIMSLTGHS